MATAPLVPGCIRCGGLRYKYSKTGLCRSCSFATRNGADNPNWRGGKFDHPLYETWHEMRARCKRPSHKRWADYGGRGIFVCDRWDQDFWAFVADMGERPTRYVLDRIDNDGPYAPDNCRWTDYSTSAINRRTAGWEHRNRNELGQFV